MPRPAFRRAAAAAAACAALLAARPAPAQFLTRPEIAWRTLETEHFVFHFPEAMREWTRDVAERADDVHEAVRALVGYAPPGRVRVIVEDPTNVSNGFALPFVDSPAIFLWPTPPAPTSQIGHSRGWGELLAVHEFAHVAHLTRPTRNARQRMLWRLLPVELSPVARRSPRWVTEGYATVVEGQLTGSGRPASAARAAILRQWALEGQLPSYGQLDGSSRFLGGSMAYLVGSAYLEWLQAQRGDSSLAQLWRRMTARQDRSFPAAFEGVFGAPPDELYGRFTAEVTRRAFAVEDSLAARDSLAGLRGTEGTLVQRLSFATGAPALSRDGRRIAVVLRRPERPSRLVVWDAADPPDTAAARARARVLERDPQDVPAVRERPTPRRARHTLHPVAGRSHEEPRFLPDGERILVVRSVPRGDGSERPDVFLWRFATGELRRVTHGAAVREADPAPDGRRAAGVRCLNGLCDLVELSLESGALRVLWPGAPARTLARPRWSPAGDSILVSVQEGGRWRLALLPAAGGAPRWLPTPDSASRYGAAFLPGGRAIVTTSERGGVMHLERLDLATGAARALTRPTGAHVAPDAADSGLVHFLALHARGYDLRRVHPDSILADDPPRLAGALFPAAPPAVAPAADSFARAALPPDRAYGWGPQRVRPLVGVQHAAEGRATSGVVVGGDPVGRLGWVLQGALPEHGAWGGGALAVELRRLAPRLRAELFGTRHRPSRQRSLPGLDDAGLAALETLDHEHAGAAIGTTLRRDHGAWGYGARADLGLGRLSALAVPAGEAPRDFDRALASAGLEARASVARDRHGLSLALAADGASGRTADSAWTRGLASAALGVRLFGLGVRGSGAVGATSAGAPGYERFVIGGNRAALLSAGLLSQRLAVPALPVGLAAGRRVAVWRVETSLLGLTPYFQAVGAGDAWQAPWRVAGAEIAFATPAVSFVTLPSVRVLAGAAHSLDEGDRGRTRVYAGVTYAP